LSVDWVDMVENNYINTAATHTFLKSATAGLNDSLIKNKG
jgi:hypothetical protein